MEEPSVVQNVLFIKDLLNPIDLARINKVLKDEAAVEFCRLLLIFGSVRCSDRIKLCILF